MADDNRRDENGNLVNDDGENMGNVDEDIERDDGTGLGETDETDNDW